MRDIKNVEWTELLSASDLGGMTILNPSHSAAELFDDKQSYAVLLDSSNSIAKQHSKKLDQIAENTNFIENQAEEMARIADIAEKRVKLAEQEALSANLAAKAAEKIASIAKRQAEEAYKGSQTARRQSWVSNAIAVTAILIALLAWLLPNGLHSLPGL